jgi:hypothetical protein
MGPPGVGKSTVSTILYESGLLVDCGLQFVNALCGRAVMKVDDSLHTCTTVLKHVILEPNNGPFKGRRVVIVDTPPFNQTKNSVRIPDSEILRGIAVWLAKS